MATKRKRSSGTWEFVVKNKSLLPRPISLTFDSEDEGDAYCAHLEKLLANGIVPEEFRLAAKKTITTIGDAIYAYIEAVHITDDDVCILSVLPRGAHGGLKLEKANYQWAEAWVKELQSGDAAPSTIRKKVGALARCLDWTLRREDTMLVANPLRMLPKRYATTATSRKDVERDRRLQAGEEEKIWAILNREKPEGRERPLALPEADALKLMLTLALETAMRMRETYTLTTNQLDVKNRTIFLDKTKNGDKRQVPLSSVAAKALTEYMDAGKPMPDGRLFSFWDGETTPNKLRTTTSRLSQQWGRIFSAAGCPDFNYHDLRHEATSRIFERTTLSDVEIAKITGHSSTKMLMRYANLRASVLAAKLW